MPKPEPVQLQHPFEFIGPHREALKVTFGALEFEGVVMRAFPLRANLNRLTTFCDRYLNSDIPEEIAQFKPAAPYVLMMVLNYGRMADTASNMGWVAQNEVFFGVPLVGRWNEDGKIVRGPAVVTPFIFVDNEWSMATGREVYGWPKMPVWLEPGLNSWLRDPRAARRLMTLKTLSMTELYQEQRAAAQTLIEIEQESHHVFGQVPPNLDYLLQPLLRLPKAVADTLSAAPDFLQSLGRTFQLTRGADLPGLISQGFKGLAKGGPNIYGNTINLKQFRASSHPGSVCYQALVNSRMQIKRFNGGGMMGSVDVLRGDPTAGFSIHVHQLPAYPIIESLGIEVERTRVRQGVSVAELKPLLPFWASLDMRYERGRRICWRGYDTPWKAWGDDKPEEKAKKGEKPGPPSFNTTLGPVVEAPQGPFDFYDASIRVLPLRADPKQLEKLSPDLSAVDFAASPSLYSPSDDEAFVFLVVTSYGEMSSTANNIGWWAKNEVSIVTPILLDSFPWLIWLYSFSDSPLAVTEGREVVGLPSAYARISAGADPWLQGSGIGKDRQLLTLSTMDYPAAGVGQQAIEQRLLEINRSDQPSPAESFSFKEALAKYQERGIRLQNLSLKEFRDEERPDTPCYQALVGFTSELGEFAEREAGNDDAENIRVRALPGDHTVTFTSTPSWPIAEKLGLKHRSVRSEGGSPVAVCEVVEPFWIKTNIRAHLSEALAKREIGSNDWSETGHHKIIEEIMQIFLVDFKKRQGLLADILQDVEDIRDVAGKKAKRKTDKQAT